MEVVFRSGFCRGAFKLAVLSFCLPRAVLLAGVTSPLTLDVLSLFALALLRSSGSTDLDCLRDAFGPVFTCSDMNLLTFLPMPV